MTRARPLELLQSLLSGEILEPSVLDAFVVEAAAEGQWHDFKSGKITDLKKVILEYVSGFANSDGGILVVGVTERDSTGRRRVDGAKAPGTATLHDWAAQILLGQATFYNPPPRIAVVAHPDGEVLIIATARSPLLVPFVRDGRNHFMMRFGDVTKEVPEFLLADLFFSRRQRPVLDVGGLEFDEKLIETTVATAGVIHANVNADVVNLFLVPAAAVEVCAVSWSLTERGNPTRPKPEPVPLLKQYVDAVDPTDRYDGNSAAEWRLRRSQLLAGSDPSFSIATFATRQVRGQCAMVPRSPGAGVLEFAIYVMSGSTPPEWFAVSWQYNVTAYGQRIWLATTKLNVGKATERPRIHWSGPPES